MSNKAKTTTMKDDAKPALMPKLRFLEFRDAAGWPQQQLGSVATFFKGKGLPKSALIPGGKTPCIHYGELFTVYPEVIREVRSRTNLEGDVFWSAKNDVLMPTSDVTPSGLAKACCLNFENVILGGDILIIRTDRHSINGEFLARYIRHLERKVLQLVSGSTVFHLYASSMEKLTLSFPPEPSEQQKIADCLSSVDELIAAQSREVDALTTHKNGLMQQLFPSEGESQPRLRFPEFQDAGEWKEKRLDELAQYENGKAHENDISEIGQYIVVNSKFISTEGEVRKFSNVGFCVADAGNILMVLSDVPNGRAIAKCYFVESDDLYTVNQRICKIQPTKVIGRFLFYILDRNPYFLGFDDGIKQTNLRKEDVLGCPLSVPPMHDEQLRIADCLTSLDRLIAAQTQKLDALKTHKRGLMQQLFPSMWEA